MERVVEHVQKPQVMEKIVNVPKITQQVEDTKYRESATQQRTSEQVANTRVPRGEQASRRHSGGQDHQDESAVKENPTIQEKSQPRDEAKRNSPDSRSLKRPWWHRGRIQQSRPSRKTWRLIKCSRGKCRRCGFRNRDRCKTTQRADFVTEGWTRPSSITSCNRSTDIAETTNQVNQLDTKQRRGLTVLLRSYAPRPQKGKAGACAARHVTTCATAPQHCTQQLYSLSLSDCVVVLYSVALTGRPGGHRLISSPLILLSLSYFHSYSLSLSLTLSLSLPLTFSLILLLSLSLSLSLTLSLSYTHLSHHLSLHSLTLSF